MKFKKAFTLAELAVVLAVTAIIAAVIAGVCVFANSFFKQKQISSFRQNEIVLFQKQFLQCLEGFQSSQYTLINCKPQNFVAFQSGSGQSTISFQNKTLFNQQTHICQFSYIQNVVFAATDNLIYCTVNFNESFSQKLVFNKRI